MIKVVLLNSLFLITLLLNGCESSKDNNDNCNERETGNPIEGIRIAWDYSSMQQLAPKGGYPRLLRMADNSIVVVSEDYEGSSFLIRSYDEGKSWTSPFYIFPKSTVSNTIVYKANPEIIQLKNGEILVVCNYRPVIDERIPFAIAIRKSTDNGETWSDEKVIYEAQPRFKDGCWEPSFLQLLDGRVQIYFANEAKYTHSDEQEISVISSNDNGESWTTLKTVSFRANRRDGMPVARRINDEIVVVIEDNKTDRFKPYTVRCKITDNWSSPVLSDSPNREYALVDKISDNIYLGAPYLLVLPSGETLISYQTNENRNEDWELSTMEVAIGDKTARKFIKRSRPFITSLNEQAKWNSIALWDNDKTIAALASTDIKNGAISPWLIKGYILSDIKVTEKVITEYPLFVGSQSEANVKAGIGVDNDNIYIKCIVSDSTPVPANSGTQKGDGIYLYIDSDNSSLKAPDKGIYKIWCSDQGEYELWEGKCGKWEKSSIHGIKISNQKTQEGYTLDFIIPLNNISSLTNPTIRLGLALSNYISQYNSVIEQIAHGEDSESRTWIKVELKAIT
jgi:hypothetical protein